MKKIAIHLCAYKRQSTARIAYAALDRLRVQLHEAGYHSTVYTAVSNHDDQRLCMSYGHHTLMLPNNPVGKKFDDLLKYILKDHDWDYLLEYGSDNILSTDYVPTVAALLEQGHQRIALNSFYIVDAAKKEPTLLFVKPGATSNIGRITDRASIEKTIRTHNFVYEHRLNSGLDHDSHTRISRASKTPVHLLETYPPLLVDIKDSGSMHGYASFAKYPEKYPAVYLSGNFPELEPITTEPCPPQEKSEATPSASTSPTPQSQTPEPPQPAEPTETTHGKMTPSSSSPAQPPAPSPAAAKSSTPRRKTTTAAAKSSREAAAGPSAPKD